MGSNAGFGAQSEPLTPSFEPMKQLAYIFLTPIRVKPPSKRISSLETPEFLDVRD
ncbi:hypothetical protein [Nostoc sp. PA-18-2419]|uniref:hypothetical protein n=1 Tax=Nostoc sp. PA-18-2419 TaxID=2575443 RepID=UPI0016761CEB|nr:hypothetical protein [Nostoc sp. PA-18-2419]